MSKSTRVVVTVLAGIIAGWCGYWIGHWFGWSSNADWPTSLGGGAGAIILSIALAVGAVLAVGWPLGVMTRMGRARHSSDPPRPSTQL